MKVCVFTDFRFVASNSPTGVGKHICQMVNGLATCPGYTIELARCRDQLFADGSGFHAYPSTVLPFPWKLGEAIWTVSGLPYADRWVKDVDWVYCPKNDYLPLRKARVAVTVHGAAELDPNFPKSTSLKSKIFQLRRRLGYHRLLRQADAVLVVSEFLAQQVNEWFGVPRKKIFIIGNGVEDVYFQAGRNPLPQEGQTPAILCVGGLNFTDGGDRIIQVAKHVQKRLPEARFLVAGAQHDERMLNVAKSVNNIDLLGYVAAPALAELMRTASLLFYPTRYETFGIAAAEAMAAGVPVVTCRSTAVPEIVADAGVYVDPDRYEDCAASIVDLIADSPRRQQIIAAGKARAKSFTWERCVQSLKQVLEHN